MKCVRTVLDLRAPVDLERNPDLGLLAARPEIRRLQRTVGPDDQGPYIRDAIAVQIMNADGTNVRPLRPEDPLRRSGDGAPSWSPDGKQIIFSTERVDPLGEPDYDGDLPASTNSIYIINVDGTGLTRLTDAGGDDFMPVWIGDQ